MSFTVVLLHSVEPSTSFFLSSSRRVVLTTVTTASSSLQLLAKKSAFCCDHLRIGGWNSLLPLKRFGIRTVTAAATTTSTISITRGGTRTWTASSIRSSASTSCIFPPSSVLVRSKGPQLPTQSPHKQRRESKTCLAVAAESAQVGGAADSSSGDLDSNEDDEEEDKDQEQVEQKREQGNEDSSSSVIEGNSQRQDDDDVEEQQQEGQTGWLHNQPSDSSNFWYDDRRNGSTRRRSINSSSTRSTERKTGPSSEGFRTGWLHNTKKKKQKQQERQKSSMSSSTAATTSLARQRLEYAMIQSERNHRIVHPPTFHSCGGKSGMDGLIVVTEHVISVPITYNNDPTTTRSEDGSSSSTTGSRSSSGRIDVYFTITERVLSNDDEHVFRDMQQITMDPRQRATSYVRWANMMDADSMILYLQGGPGFGSPTSNLGLSMSKGSSWASSALYDIPGGKIRRVVLMDQRGTGKSTPITKQTLEMRFPHLFLLDDLPDDDVGKKNKKDGTTRKTMSPLSIDDYALSHPEKYQLVRDAVSEATYYLSQFRADNIVRDAETIRDALMLPSFNDRGIIAENDNDDDEQRNDDNTKRPKPWGACLGQSFGGFCLMSYLSLIDHPPKICLFTGGIAPILTPIIDVYDSLWDRVQERNHNYYEMYPGDVRLVKKIVRTILNNKKTAAVRLPSGGILTARRFLQLGLDLGFSPSSFASIHHLINTAFVDFDNCGTMDADNEGFKPVFSRAFLKAIDSRQVFDDHPIYFWLHESIYANGAGHKSDGAVVRNIPTSWSAHRAYENKIKTFPNEFDYERTAYMDNDDDHPTLFFGEMVFPWMSEDYAELSGLGLTSLANSLASKTDWGPLWDGKHMMEALSLSSSSTNTTSLSLSSSPRCRAAAAIYYDDMYVDFDASMRVTSSKKSRNRREKNNFGGVGGDSVVVDGDGPLMNCKVWIQNDYQHSGLRDDGAYIFQKLYGMATGSIRTPS